MGIRIVERRNGRRIERRPQIPPEVAFSSGACGNFRTTLTLEPLLCDAVGRDP